MAKHKNRFLQITLEPGKDISLLYASKILKLSEKSGISRALVSPATIVQNLQGSLGVVTLLIPPEMSTPAFQKSIHEDGNFQIVGSGFFDPSTGVIRELWFDYETIDRILDSTDSPLDPSVVLVEMLLERYSGMAFVAVESGDHRKAQTLEAAGLEKISLEGSGGAFYGRGIPDFALEEPLEGPVAPGKTDSPEEDEDEVDPDSDLIQRAVDEIHDWFGIEISLELLHKLLIEDDYLIHDLRKWDMDTVVRESFADFLAERFSERGSYPTNGDGWSEEQLDSFIEEINGGIRETELALS